MMQNKFNFFVESSISDDIYKAATKSKEGRYDNMILCGVATANIEDKQGEILEPSGFEFDEFLKSGHINLEHFYVRQRDPSSIIGHPLDAYVENDKFYIKAKLWKGQEKAEKLWDTLLVMKENNVPRTLGWSIEGNKKEIDPGNKKRIVKAKINHCALTFSPIGYNTFAEIVKGEQKSDYSPLLFNVEHLNNGVYALRLEEDGKIITVNTDFSVDVKPKSIKESLSKDVNWGTISKAIKSGLIKESNISDIINKIIKNSY